MGAERPDCLGVCPYSGLVEIIYSGRKDYSAADMYDMGLLTRVFSDEEFEEKFEEVVANISSKKPAALRMGKEIMAKTFEGCGLDAALALERNGIQWLNNSPEALAALAAFKGAPRGFMKKQRKDNIKADSAK